MEYYRLSDNEKYGIVEITKENVILAETCYQIRFRKYLKEYTDEDIDDITFCERWTAKQCFYAMKHKEEYDFRKILNAACLAVNRENSTHLRAFERMQIVELICKEAEDVKQGSLLEGFKVLLQNDDYALINLIRGLKGKIIGKDMVRDNYSFSTKLCHYASLYLFENGKDKDRYAVYDSVLKENLPKYYWYYCKKKPEKSFYTEIKTEEKTTYEEDYKNYLEIIDEVRVYVENLTGLYINREEFDHLLWVYHS